MAGRERIQRFRGKYLQDKTQSDKVNNQRDATARGEQAYYNQVAGISGGRETSTRQELAKLRTALTKNNFTYRKADSNPANGRMKVASVKDRNGNVLGNAVTMRRQNQYNRNVRTGGPDDRIGLRKGIGTKQSVLRAFATTVQPKEDTDTNSPPDEE